MKIKKCEMCKENEFESAGGNGRFCPPCLNDRRRERARIADIKLREEKRSELDDNFIKLNLCGFSLLPINFDRVSDIKMFSYTNHFRKSWFEVLVYYNKTEELEQSLKDGFSKYVKETGKKGLFPYIKSIGMLESFAKYFDLNEIRSFAGVSNQNNKEKDWEKKFFDTVDRLGRLPLTDEEFKNFSKTTLGTYAKKFGFKSDFLNNVIKKYVDEETYLNYLKEKELRLKIRYEDKSKSIIGQFKYSNEDILERVKFTVDEYIEEYGVLPSSIIFSKQSKLSTRTLIQRLNMTYSETLKHLGYNVDSRGSKREIITINKISELLKVESDNQMTFDWLKGVRGNPLRCDGYFANYKLIVEFDGEQHFFPVDFAGRGIEWATKNMLYTQANDRIKNTLIPLNNLILIRIAYNDPYWDEDFLRMRLIENNIIPPNYNLVEDSALALSL